MPSPIQSSAATAVAAEDCMGDGMATLTIWCVILEYTLYYNLVE
jgi:hypothetical protein